MPESRSRKKATYTPPPAKSTGPKVNAPWFLPVMLGLMILGLALDRRHVPHAVAVPDPAASTSGTCSSGFVLHHRRLRHDDPLALTPAAVRRRRPQLRAAPSSTPTVRARSSPPRPEAVPQGRSDLRNIGSVPSGAQVCG